MTQKSAESGSGLRIGDLEAQYPLYCKAMRRLVRDGVPLTKARRTICWERLFRLHASLPRQYRDPELLFLHLQREQREQQTAAVSNPQLATASA